MARDTQRRLAAIVSADVIGYSRLMGADEAGTLGLLRALDILINNAGTNIPQAFVDVESAVLDTMLNLNVRAAFIVAQADINRMLQGSNCAERGGAVVNISSQPGRVAAAFTP